MVQSPKQGKFYEVIASGNGQEIVLNSPTQAITQKQFSQIHRDCFNLQGVKLITVAVADFSCNVLFNTTYDIPAGFAYRDQESPIPQLYAQAAINAGL